MIGTLTAAALASRCLGTSGPASAPASAWPVIPDPVEAIGADAIPWNDVKKAWALGRRRWFSKPRPEGTYFRVEATPGQIRREFGRRGYAPNWEQSFYKRGEEVNLADVRYSYDEDVPPAPDAVARVWWQTHLRGWPHDGGIDLIAHWELEPTENPDGHLDGVGFSYTEGMSNIEPILDEIEQRHGYNYHRVEWPPGDRR